MQRLSEEDRDGINPSMDDGPRDGDHVGKRLVYAEPPTPILSRPIPSLKCGLDEITDKTDQCLATMALLDPTRFIADTDTGIVNGYYLFKNCLPKVKDEFIEDFLRTYAEELKRHESSPEKGYQVYSVDQSKIDQVLLKRGKVLVYSGVCYFFCLSRLISLVPWQHRLAVYSVMLKTACCDEVREEVKKELNFLSFCGAKLWGSLLPHPGVVQP